MMMTVSRNSFAQFGGSHFASCRNLFCKSSSHERVHRTFLTIYKVRSHGTWGLAARLATQRGALLCQGGITDDQRHPRFDLADRHRLHGIQAPLRCGRDRALRETRRRAMTLDQLAAGCAIPHRTLRISADAMVSLGLVERNDVLYRNGAAADAFLSGSDHCPDLRPMLRFLDRICYEMWMGLEEGVRAGEGGRHFDRFSDEDQQIFSSGVEAFSGGAAAALAAIYDFSAHRRVLDVAGGTGSFLIPVLRRYATLHATLFELPG